MEPLNALPALMLIIYKWLNMYPVHYCVVRAVLSTNKKLVNIMFQK